MTRCFFRLKLHENKIMRRLIDLKYIFDLQCIDRLIKKNQLLIRVYIIIRIENINASRILLGLNVLNRHRRAFNFRTTRWKVLGVVAENYTAIRVGNCESKVSASTKIYTVNIKKNIRVNTIQKLTLSMSWKSPSCIGYECRSH